jgi:hypothetical protein
MVAFIGHVQETAGIPLEVSTWSFHVLDSEEFPKNPER